MPGVSDPRASTTDLYTKRMEDSIVFCNFAETTGFLPAPGLLLGPFDHCPRHFRYIVLLSGDPADFLPQNWFQFAVRANVVEALGPAVDP